MDTRPYLTITPRRGREAPAAIVRQLREIDPAAELHYAGRGKWMLGTVRPNRVISRRAQRRITVLRALSPLLSKGAVALTSKRVALVHYRLWCYELQRQGFRPITTYTVQGEPGSDIVADFRRRDWLYRHSFQEQLAAYEAAADQDTREERALQQLQEYLEAESSSIHHYAMRGRRHIGPRRAKGKRPARRTI
jgi:hypothetical protein